jgi:hypothetical protein
MTKLENDLNTKVDEISVQRKALETSWNENNELKRTLAEVRAECENLRSQIGLGMDFSSPHLPLPSLLLPAWLSGCLTGYVRGK